MADKNDDKVEVKLNKEQEANQARFEGRDQEYGGKTVDPTPIREVYPDEYKAVEEAEAAKEEAAKEGPTAEEENRAANATLDAATKANIFNQAATPVPPVVVETGNGTVAIEPGAVATPEAREEAERRLAEVNQDAAGNPAVAAGLDQAQQTAETLGLDKLKENADAGLTVIPGDANNDPEVAAQAEEAKQEQAEKQVEEAKDNNKSAGERRSDNQAAAKKLAKKQAKAAKKKKK